MQVTVKNIGAETWAANGKYPVHLSYLWFIGGKQLPIEPPRSFLPADVPSGAIQSLKVTVVAPKNPGQYTLKFTMVQESVAWFLSGGAKTLDVPVTVE